MYQSEAYGVAVIIPCWNCSSYIGEMIMCLLQQTFQDWKAFLVDDLSTDETYSTIQSFSTHDSRIIAIQRNRLPKGAQTCRNIGFELSEGADYVVFFDADDLIAPFCLEQRVQFMNANPDLDFSAFPSKSFVNEPNEIEGAILFGFRYPDLSDVQRLLRRTHPFVIWSNIYRRDALVRSGVSWDERILSFQDSDFNMQTFHRRLRYNYCDSSKIDYFYRIGYSDTTTSRKILSAAHKESHLYFLDKLINSLSKDEQYRYHLELDDYVLFFIEIFYYDSTFVSKLLHLSWTKNRLGFCTRARFFHILKKMKRSGKRFLFPILNTYRKEDDVKYKDYQNLFLLSHRND